MIVGTIALIAFLFFGGVQDYFLVTGLEAGIKEYVLDKERKKELLAEFKIAKKELKDKDKSRAKFIKTFKDVNTRYTYTSDDLQSMRDSLMSNMIAQQEIVIITRLRLIHNIYDKEWDQIIALSIEMVNKDKEKLQQNIDKGKVKDPFIHLKKVIEKQLTDEGRKQKVLASLETYKGQMEKLTHKMSERNVIDTPVLSNKSSSAEDLKSVAHEVNQIRMETFDFMLDFRSDLKEYTVEKEWNKIIKEFNKVLI